MMVGKRMCFLINNSDHPNSFVDSNYSIVIETPYGDISTNRNAYEHRLPIQHNLPEYYSNYADQQFPYECHRIRATQRSHARSTFTHPYMGRKHFACVYGTVLRNDGLFRVRPQNTMCAFTRVSLSHIKRILLYIVSLQVQHRT